jgi:hypothetical protein
MECEFKLDLNDTPYGPTECTVDFFVCHPVNMHAPATENNTLMLPTPSYTSSVIIGAWIYGVSHANQADGIRTRVGNCYILLERPRRLQANDKSQLTIPWYADEDYQQKKAPLGQLRFQVLTPELNKTVRVAIPDFTTLAISTLQTNALTEYKKHNLIIDEAIRWYASIVYLPALRSLVPIVTVINTHKLKLRVDGHWLLHMIEKVVRPLDPNRERHESMLAHVLFLPGLCFPYRVDTAADGISSHTDQWTHPAICAPHTRPQDVATDCEDTSLLAASIWCNLNKISKEYSHVDAFQLKAMVERYTMFMISGELAGYQDHNYGLHCWCVLLDNRFVNTRTTRVKLKYHRPILIETTEYLNPIPWAEALPDYCKSSDGKDNPEFTEAIGNSAHGNARVDCADRIFDQAYPHYRDIVAMFEVGTDVLRAKEFVPIVRIADQNTTRRATFAELMSYDSNIRFIEIDSYQPDGASVKVPRVHTDATIRNIMAPEVTWTAPSQSHEIPKGKDFIIINHHDAISEPPNPEPKQEYNIQIADAHHKDGTTTAVGFVARRYDEAASSTSPRGP